MIEHIIAYTIIIDFASINTPSLNSYFQS